jgi:hypothetical protein
VFAGQRVTLRASVGAALSVGGEVDVEGLFHRADVAMYAAKRDKLSIAVWEARYDQHGMDRLSLMSDLRRAVDNDEFTLVYQPMVAFAGGGDHDVEALIRWRHPARGVVPPIEFIAFAEQTGYVRAITRWVLDAQSPRDMAPQRSQEMLPPTSRRDVMMPIAQRWLRVARAPWMRPNGSRRDLRTVFSTTQALSAIWNGCTLGKLPSTISARAIHRSRIAPVAGAKDRRRRSSSEWCVTTATPQRALDHRPRSWHGLGVV